MQNHKGLKPHESLILCNTGSSGVTKTKKHFATDTGNSVQNRYARRVETRALCFPYRKYLFIIGVSIKKNSKMPFHQLVSL